MGGPGAGHSQRRETGSSQGRGKFRSGAGGHGKTRPVTAHSCFWLTAPCPAASQSLCLPCSAAPPPAIRSVCPSPHARPPGPTIPLAHSPHSPMAPRSGVPCCQLLWNIPLLSLPYYFKVVRLGPFLHLGLSKASQVPFTSTRGPWDHTPSRGDSGSWAAGRPRSRQASFLPLLSCH